MLTIWIFLRPSIGASTRKQRYSIADTEHCIANMKPLRFISLVSTLVVLFTGVSGFSEPLSIPRRGNPARIAPLQNAASPASPLADANDPFESYQQSPDQQLRVKDTVIGDGEVAQNGKVLTVAYQGRLMSTGKQFDQGEGYSFRLGEGKVIPGWEQGLLGMKVGGKRTLRIPPNLAYAERGAKDVIPPNSHLEFDCELISIASNPFEEALAQVNLQKERVITFVLLLILLIASPTFGS